MCSLPPERLLNAATSFVISLKEQDVGVSCARLSIYIVMNLSCSGEDLASLSSCFLLWGCQLEPIIKYRTSLIEADGGILFSLITTSDMSNVSAIGENVGGYALYYPAPRCRPKSIVEIILLEHHGAFSWLSTILAMTNFNCIREALASSNFWYLSLMSQLMSITNIDTVWKECDCDVRFWFLFTIMTIVRRPCIGGLVATFDWCWQSLKSWSIKFRLLLSQEVYIKSIVDHKGNPQTTSLIKSRFHVIKSKENQN